MSAYHILLIYIILFILEYGFDLFLDVLNIRHVAAHATTIPEFFKTFIDKETYEKSVAYTQTKARFGILSGSFSSFFILATLVSGALGWLEAYVTHFNWGIYWTGITYIFGISFLFSIISMPFGLYSQFVIEERFGFNTMTWKLFILDTIKGLVLSALIGVPVLLAVFWFMDTTGPWWWLWTFGFISIFQLVMVVIYPTLIAPLFNKFTPLEDGPLKEKIEALATKLDFKISGIFVMDGSKRSKHSNAYFTGLGKIKRIVLFDTLIENHSQEQLLAVLAHEIGHSKMNHIRKQLVVSFAMMLLGLYFLYLFLQWDVFFTAFGFHGSSYHAALILFGFCSAPITFWLSPLSNWRSRVHEYEADAFAAKAVESGVPLQEALLALSKDNLSNLTPHPWYSFFHYSHPTLHERVAALEKFNKPSE